MHPDKQVRKDVWWAVKHAHMIVLGMFLLLCIVTWHAIYWEIADLLALAAVKVLGHDAELGP